MHMSGTHKTTLDMGACCAVLYAHVVDIQKLVYSRRDIVLNPVKIGKAGLKC